MTTLSDWHQAVLVEYQQETSLITQAEIIQVISTRSNQADLIIKLKQNSGHFWHEKQIDQEILRDPSLYFVKVLSTGVNAKILCAEREQGQLRVTISTYNKLLDLSQATDLRIQPIIFLDPLMHRMTERYEEEQEFASHRDYKKEALKLYAQSATLAAQSRLSDVEGGARHYRNLLHSFRPAQVAAIEAAKALPLSFIWGPPGTGKTHTLGHIVAQLTSQDSACKVLAIAIANRGIEQMLLKANSAYKELNGQSPIKGKFLRTQVPTLTEIAKLDHLTAWSELIEQEHQDLQSYLTKIESQRLAWSAAKEQTQKDQCSQRLEILTDEMEQIKEQYKSKRDQLIFTSQAVFCTINQYSWVPTLKFQAYDVVIFEEASMIPSYYLIDIMEMARIVNPKVRFIISGDPKQLPPIVNREKHSKNSSWIESPFVFFEANDLNKAPIVNEISTDTPLSVVNFLDQQSRMPPDLGLAVSESFYEGRLQSTRTIAETNYVPAWPTSGFCYINTHQGDWLRWVKEQMTNTECFPKMPMDFDFTNVSQEEAVITTTLAKVAIESGISKVLIITPYRNQYAMISKFIFSLGIHEHCDCSTVHSAQGSEAPLILFSLVNPTSQFLHAKEAAYLHTVALSRAQEQLIVVGGVMSSSNRHLKKPAKHWTRCLSPKNFNT